MSKPENFFQRARRVVASNLDNALSAAERATGPALLQQAVRDLETGRARLHRAQMAAELEASRLRARASDEKGKAKALGEDAAYALGKGREGLAREALEMQVRQEDAARDTAQAAKASDDNGKELALAVLELDTEIERARSDIQSIVQHGTKDSAVVASKSEKAARLVDRSRALIDRVSEQYVAGTADIAALRRQDDIDARLEALKSKQKTKRSSKKA